MPAPSIDPPPTTALTATPTDISTLQSVAVVAATKASLSPEEFQAYVNAEIDLLVALADRGWQLFATGDLRAAMESLLIVRERAGTAQTIVARELQSVEADARFDSDTRRELVASLHTVEGFFEFDTKWAEALWELYNGLLQRLEGNPSSSVQAIERAIELFNRFSPEETSPITGVPMAVMQAICNYNLPVARAVMYMKSIRYREASAEFLSARAAIERVLAGVGVHATSGEDDPSAPLRVSALVEGDLLSVKALFEFTQVQAAYLEGNFLAALAAAKRNVAVASETVDKLSEGGMPEVFLRLQRTGVRYAEGWEFYIEGELAIDRGDWDKALDHLERARGTWFAAAADAVNTGIPSGRALSEQLLNFAPAILQSSTRRCDRERQLNKRISDLERQLSEARSINIESLKDLTMKDKIDISNVHDSVVNVNSTLTEVSQIIGKAPIDAQKRGELKDMVQQLERALAKVAADKGELAGAVADALKDTLEKVAQPQPNRKSIQISAKGMVEAAKGIADVLPIATKIATTVAGMFGFVV